MTRQPPKTVEEGLRRWREARFGMFIHWGLYAVPAGIWKGKETPLIGEWIQSMFRIPNDEYARLAEQFNPVRFDAREWVRIARDAGMRYMVVTAKHHEGFAMFKSEASPFNIVDATPFGRDPLAELAEACAEVDMPLGFYYSQSLDWHERDAGGWRDTGPNVGGMDWGNTWDFPENRGKNFARFLREKVKPQLRELLTNYGPVMLIWFDTPHEITREQSVDICDFVHDLQPGCLVNGRIGNGAGDYGSLGDNQVPAGGDGDRETPATLNETWGYKKNDSDWKPASELVHLMVDIVGKGANYLLNVGPTAEGVIPAPSVRRLRAVGEWLSVNGDAVYATRGSPWPGTFDWGRVTCRDGRVFLHFLKWPRGRFVLRGLRNRVRSARLLCAPEETLSFEQSRDEAADLDELRIDLPSRKPAKLVPVVELVVDGAPEVDELLNQQRGGTLELPTALAAFDGPKSAKFPDVTSAGMLSAWSDPRVRLAWRVRVAEPGRFRVRLHFESPHYQQQPVLGDGYVLRIGDDEMRVATDESVPVDDPRAVHYPQRMVDAGAIRIDEAGPLDVTLALDGKQNDAGDGPHIAAVRIDPR